MHRRVDDGGNRTRRTVLKDVTDDAELVKVTAASLSTERLFEGDLDVADGVLVPESVGSDVSKPEDEQVLDHLLPEIVIDPVGLIL